MTDDKEAKRQAVEIAATEIVTGQRGAISAGQALGDGYVSVPVEQFRLLKDAVAALNEPTPVRPEELPHGCAFTFAEEWSRPIPGPYRVVMCVDPDQRLRWLAGDGSVYGFVEHDRVFPSHIQDKPEGAPEFTRECAACGLPYTGYEQICDRCAKSP